MRRTTTSVLVVLLSAALAGQSYVPARVFGGPKHQLTDLEALLADAAGADVVFVGEDHDDANTHRLERVLLEGLARRRGDIVLALEMFERDVQEPFDHFQMGHVDEADFLREARPWDRYATFYKPLVDFAIDHRWPVVAANVPRAIAAEVAASGLDVLAKKSPEEQAWFARERQCPLQGDFFKRFREAMSDHDSPSAKPSSSEQAMDRYYFAQCLKDETMGESIAQAYAGLAIGGKRPLVVSINGDFHTDFRGGLVERTARRLPDKRLVIVTIQAVRDVDRPTSTSEDRKRADYIIYTTARPPAPPPTAPRGAAPSAGSSSSAR